MKLIIIFVLIINNYYYIDCVDKCPVGWVAYDDQLKCIKIVRELIDTYSSAADRCSKLDTGATLLTIHSQREQDYLIDLLYVKNKLVDTVWLGGQVQLDQLTWIDDSPVTYLNWISGRPHNVTELECVEMLADPYQGKWVDVTCTKHNMLVCQLMQAQPVSELEKLIIQTRKELHDLKENFTRQLDKITMNPVPVGFIYTQLPGQPEPSQLWPGVKWQNITADYSGLFFRAEGSGSAEFGQIQAANWSRLASMNSFVEYASTTKDIGWKINDYPVSGWSNDTGFYYSTNMYLYFTESDNRPRNQAIRLFKRI